MPKKAKQMRVINLAHDKKSALIIGRDGRKLAINTDGGQHTFISTTTQERYKVEKGQVEYLGRQK